MKRNLITGGAGFIGSHLCELLLAQGESVVVLDNLSTGDYRHIAPLESHPGFTCIVDEVQNDALMEQLIRDCDCIYHLAASVGVRLVIERPTECLVNNIIGTEVVLRYACRYRRPVLITSTSEVYGKSNKTPFSETDDSILGPTCKSRWGYAASKAIDEFLALAYFEEKLLPVVIVRLFNTVGPRQTGRYGMVIPNFVQQALKNEPITVFGDGKQTRCFAHVKDIVPAMEKLLAHPEARGKVFNRGSQEEVTIMELAERIIALTGSKSEIRLIPYAEAYSEGFEDMLRRVPDLSKTNALIGYKPKHNLETIINDIINQKEGC